MTTRLIRLTILALAALPGSAAPAEAPVIFNGRTLFTLRTAVGSFSPEARAEALQDRLITLSADRLAKIGPLTTVKGASSTDIDAGDVVLLSITDQDAAAEGKPRDVLAASYAQILENALRTSREERSLKQRLEDLGLSLVLTAFFILILRLVQLGFRRLHANFESWRGTRIRGVRLQRLELLTAQRATWILISAARCIEATGLLLLSYFYVSLMLSIFPETRMFAATLFANTQAGLRAAGHALAAFLPNLFTIVLIVIATRYTIKLCRYLFRAVETGMLTISGFYPEWADPSYKIVRLLVLAIAAVVIFPFIPGNDSPALRGVSIFFGVLVSLGSAGTVGNIVAGVLLTYTRAFQIGDRVRIADTLGDVTEKTLLATHIRTIKNEDITVPNSLVLSSHITNYSSCCQDRGLILHTAVTIGYDAPWRQIHQLLISAAAATPDLLSEPAPFVLQTALNDFYVQYQLNAYTREPSRMAVIYSALHQNIQDQFNEAGVEICSPHFSAIRDGNHIAIPDSYVPERYVAPAFRVNGGSGSPRPEGASLPL